MSQFYEYIINPVVANISKYGNNNAFCIKHTYFTYRQFGETVSKIRDAFARIEICGTNVGLVINDDIETYASIFALWLEGLCYVPLHPGWPKERCMNIVEQVDLKFIIDSSESNRFEGLEIIRSKDLLFTQYNYAPDTTVCDEQLAYILFTSGSTGQPKGVQISRQNIGAFMDSFWKSGIIITEADRCLQCFDLSFDVSVQGYLVPLTKGACCYTVPHEEIKYVYAANLIEDHKLTFGAMAPSMLRYLKPYYDELDMSSLRYCILTAEACPIDLTEDWRQVAIKAEIYDFYGPTEATIYCTYYKLPPGGGGGQNFKRYCLYRETYG